LVRGAYGDIVICLECVISECNTGSSGRDDNENSDFTLI